MKLVSDAGIPSCGLALRSGHPPGLVQGHFPKRHLTRGPEFKELRPLLFAVPQPSALSIVLPVCLALCM